jgi:hypothetical protein
MARILACVDASVYALSVADHAAWAARQSAASATVLHVLGRKEQGNLSDLSGALGVDANAQLLAALARLDEETSRAAQDRGRPSWIRSRLGWSPQAWFRAI